MASLQSSYPHHEIITELAEYRPSGDEMKLSAIPWSNKDINDVGDFLTHAQLATTLREMNAIYGAYRKISDWKATYEYPLRVVTTLLRHRVKSFGLDAKVSGRTKRESSIITKLKRQPTMKLTTMQDVGGCRVTVDNISGTNLLADHFRRELAPKLNGSQEYDYIAQPKTDGYRGIHFVVRYQSKNPEYKNLPVKRIEIQIRSMLQHRWATAVETVDLFTGQTLKTGGGYSKWKRFFVLTSSLFALKEECPVVEGTPSETDALMDEIRHLEEELQVVDRVWSWADAMQSILDEPLGIGSYGKYLVELDVAEKITRITAFPQEKLEEAYSTYRIVEEANRDLPHLSAVLVSAESVDELREAYPGYYGDAKAFLADVGIL